MAATYKQFLASPSPAFLAEDASLHYVPTTTSVKGAEQIFKHFALTQKQVTKKKEDILSVVEGHRALAFEVDTGLEFQTSGGPYLPGLDDNFLSDRVVYLPVIHFVLLADDGKISQIRLSWDQGALLKQLEIIGKTGRNWPIKDSREQITLIQACLKAGGVGPSGSVQDHKAALSHTRGQSTNVLRDPHATLHMQATREEIENTGKEQVVSPYGGSRPQQRSFTDVLGDEPGAAEPPSPSKSLSPGKVGSGKNFQPMRIFNNNQEEVVDEDTPKAGSSNQYIRPNPTKYQHFDFADGSDPQDAPTSGVPFDEKPKSKHDSQWSFDDFVTPSKPKPSKAHRHQDVRHWDTDKNAIASEAAVQAGKGRRDAETHFELQDDGERIVHADRPGARARGSVHNDQLGLYKNKLFDKDETTPEPKRALGNITNLSHRGKDFDPHFSMTDDSPEKQAQNPAKVSDNRQKAVKMMDANWSSYDESPKQKENARQAKPEAGSGINIAGDGMGGRKGADRNWLYGAEEDSGINIAGDGMGGRKGANRDWLYGEEAGQELPKPAAGRRTNQSAQQKNFWDF